MGWTAIFSRGSCPGSSPEEPPAGAPRRVNGSRGKPLELELAGLELRDEPYDYERALGMRRLIIAAR